jgi:acyl carrier protein
MSVHERLQEILRELLDNDQLSLSGGTTAEEVEGWDSYVQVNLMFRIEQEFGVQFTGNQIFEFKNFGELSAFVGDQITRPQTR